jgi:signal transduction histidine kinase
VELFGKKHAWECFVHLDVTHGIDFVTNTNTLLLAFIVLNVITTMAHPVLEKTSAPTKQRLIDEPAGTPSAQKSGWQVFFRLIDTISSNGIRSHYNNRLKISVSLTNGIIVTCALFAIPFLIVFGGIGHAELLIAPLMGCLLSFLLIRKGYHLLSRVFLVHFVPLTIYVIAVLIDTPNSANVAATKVLFLATLVVPLLIFRASEIRFIVSSLLFICTLLFTVDYADALFPVKILSGHRLNLSVIQTISTIEAVVFITASLIYYRHLIDKIARQNYRLLQDMRGQNEKIQQTNEELKASALQLKELNDAKNRLFSIIAHDLRSPMNSFKGFSGLLVNNIDSLSKEDVKVLVKGMSKSFNNVNTLLENLLHWSRVQMNTISYQPEVVDLAVLVTDNLNLVEAMAADKLVTVNGFVCDDLYAFVDKNVFNVVLRNLLTNAIKFTNPKGNVEIRAKRAGTTVTIEVSDNGVGMSPTTLETLFTSQNYHHSSLGTANERGTGLGLMLCKEFVEKWGGTIKATSIKGEGSTFTFTVPAYQTTLFAD